MVQEYREKTRELSLKKGKSDEMQSNYRDRKRPRNTTREIM